MKACKQDSQSVSVPFTPLIDVVFLLLIFFLVSTTFNRQEAEQTVRLPEAAGSSLMTQSGDLLLHIRAGGVIVARGRVVSLAALPALLQSWQREKTRGRVLLRGDNRASYNDVAKVMAVCRAAGIAQLSLPMATPATP